MGNFSALVFFLLCFLVPLLSPTIRRDRTLLLATYLSLALRDSIALINAFVTPILTSWGDLYRFHNIGAGLDHEVGQPYGEFLRVLYGVFGTSFWLGEQTSILVYTLSLLFFVEIGNLVGARPKLLGCLLVFGCLPSPAIHCSVTLRESYQVLSFLGSAYALLRLRAGPTPWAWMLLAFSLVTMVIMHQGLAPYAAIVLVMGVPWALQGRGHLGAAVALLCLTLLPMVVPKLIDRLADHSLVASMINEGKWMDFAANYRNFISEARSDYGIKIETDNIFAFIATTLGVIAMYFLAPLPWQVSRPIDYYAFAEVLIRGMLILGFLGQMQRQKGEVRQRLLFLFLMALSLEVLWSLGTTNWGTSLRHHVVAFGAFVLTGLPYYSGITLDKSHQELLQRRQNRAGGVVKDSQPAAGDLRALLAYLRARSRLFLGVTLAAGLGVALVTRPPALSMAELKPRFVSSGSLLLSQGRVFQLGHLLTANTFNRSDLGIWLSTEELFANFLERQHFHQRLEARLRGQHPELAAHARALTVIPRYSQVREVNLYDGSAEVELDYAQVDLSDEAGVMRQLRANRLEVIAQAPTPEGSQKLAKAAMQLLQNLLAEAATKRITAQRRTIEGYLRVGSRRIARAEKGLSKRRKADPLELEDRQKRCLALEADCRRLSRELDNLTRQEERLSRDTALQTLTSSNAVQDFVHRLEQQRVSAQQIYLPDSSALQEIDERLRHARAYAGRAERENTEKARLALSATALARQALLRQYQAELAQLKGLEPTAKLLREFREGEKELQGWQQEYLVWERQLLAARIEERLCQGDGTALPLRTPLPGQRVFGASQEFVVRYRRFLTLLPLAPLVGLIALALSHLAGQARQVSTRVVHFLDAPVVAELPPVRPRHRRHWANLLEKGAQEASAKPPP